MTARRSLTAVLATALLLVAGCSTSGDDDAATTTTAETATAPDDDETTTTEADDAEPADGPTREDLEGILPEASDVGDGWEETPDDEDGEDGEDDAELAAQCPEAAALAVDDDDDDDDDKAVRTFGNEDGAEIEVTLDAAAAAADLDQLAALVDAINDCGPITVDGDDGSTTTFEYEATVDTAYGDQGLRMQVAINLDVPEVGAVDLTVYFLGFRNGTVGVSINGTDGLDPAGPDVIPIDPEILVAVADGIDADLAELVGG